MEKLKKESQIYLLNPDDKLLEYHRAINENAFVIAKENPHLIASKNELQKLARRRLHESGFAYKKKESRSKDFGRKSTVEKKTTREKLGEEMRQERLSNVEEDLKEVELQLSYASRQRERCVNVKEFRKAIEMSKEMEELRQKKRKYQAEKAVLQKKESLNKRVKKCLEKKSKTTGLPEGNTQSIHSFFSRKIGSTNSSNVSAGKDANTSSFTSQDLSDSEEHTDHQEDAGETFQEDAGQIYEEDAGQTFQEDAGQTYEEDAGQAFQEDAGQTYEEDAGQTFQEDAKQMAQEDAKQASQESLAAPEKDETLSAFCDHETILKNTRYDHVAKMGTKNVKDF